LLMLVAGIIAVLGYLLFGLPPLVGGLLVAGAFLAGVWSDPEHKLWRPLGIIDTWRNLRDPAGAEQRLVDVLTKDWGPELADYLMSLPEMDRAHAEWVLRKAKGRDNLERTYVMGDREYRLEYECGLLERAGFVADVERVPMRDGSVAYQIRYMRVAPTPPVGWVVAGILPSDEVPGSAGAAARLPQGDSAEATQYATSHSRFGPNAGQVQWLLERLASLDAMTWASVAAEHQVAGRTGPAPFAEFARGNVGLSTAAAEATREAGVLALSAAGPDAAAAWRAEGLEAGRRSRGVPPSVAVDPAAEAELWKQAEFAWWLLSAAEWATAIMASRPAMDDSQFTALWAPYEIWLGSPPDSQAKS
jgi:hypothetical protein